MMSCCEFNEDQGKHGEYKCLHRTDKYFQSVKRNWRYIRNEEGDNDKQYLAREHVAEETKRKRDYFGKVGYELQYPYEKLYRAPEIEELFKVSQFVMGYTHYLNKYHREKGYCQCEGKVAASGAE